MTDTLTQRVAEAIYDRARDKPGIHAFCRSGAPSDSILGISERHAAESLSTYLYIHREYMAKKAIEASGAKHLQGFNLLSEKQPEVGEYCLCLCDSGDYDGIYFCTSTYHGLKNEATCGFYCHSVIAWIGESQMRNMAKEVLADLLKKVSGDI